MSIARAIHLPKLLLQGSSIRNTIKQSLSGPSRTVVSTMGCTERLLPSTLHPVRVTCNWSSRSGRLPEHRMRMAERLHRLSNEEKYCRLAMDVPTGVIKTLHSTLSAQQMLTPSPNVAQPFLIDVWAFGWGVLGVMGVPLAPLPVSTIPTIANLFYRLCRKSRNERIKNEQENRMIVLQRVFDHFRKNKELCVKFAVNVYDAYHPLAMNIYVDGRQEIAVKLFYEEIVSRVLNRIEKDSDSADYFLEMCFVHGKSDKAVVVDYHLNDGTIRRNVKLSTLIDEAGLIEFDSGSPTYYNPIGCEPLFYRELFNSETFDSNRYIKVKNPPPSPNGKYWMNSSEREAIIATVLDNTIEEK